MRIHLKNRILFKNDFFEKKKKSQSKPEVTNFTELDSHRRRISHHFQHIYKLNKMRLISDEIMKELADKDMAMCFLKTIEPLEAAIYSEYDRKSFNKFRELYPELKEKYKEIF